ATREPSGRIDSRVLPDAIGVAPDLRHRVDDLRDDPQTDLRRAGRHEVHRGIDRAPRIAIAQRLHARQRAPDRAVGREHAAGLVPQRADRLLAGALDVRPAAGELPDLLALLGRHRRPVGHLAATATRILVARRSGRDAARIDLLALVALDDVFLVLRV